MNSLRQRLGPSSVPGPLSEDQIEEVREEVEQNSDELADMEFRERVDFYKDMFRETLEGEHAAQSLVDQGIGVMVAVIVIGAVAIPVTIDVTESANVTGLTKTVLGYVDLALAVGLFVAAISIVR